MSNSNTTDGEISVKEYYGYVTHQIERQDNLINNRLTWMLTIEGFLYAGLAVIASKDTNKQIYNSLRIALPTVGVCIGLLALLGVFTALISLDGLIRGWKSRGCKENIDIGIYPVPYGALWWIAWVPTFFLPIVIVVSWVFIGIMLLWS
jgi:hypothetical protein